MLQEAPPWCYLGWETRLDNKARFLKSSFSAVSSRTASHRSSSETQECLAIGETATPLPPFSFQGLTEGRGQGRAEGGRGGDTSIMHNLHHAHPHAQQPVWCDWDGSWLEGDVCSAQTHQSLVVLRSGKSTSVALSGSHRGLGMVIAECLNLVISPSKATWLFFLNHIKSTPPLPLLNPGMETGYDYNNRVARLAPASDFAAFQFAGSPPQSHRLGLGFGSKRHWPFSSGDSKHLTRQNLPSEWAWESGLHWWPGVGLVCAVTDPWSVYSLSTKNTWLPSPKPNLSADRKTCPVKFQGEQR